MTHQNNEAPRKTFVAPRGYQVHFLRIGDRRDAESQIQSLSKVRSSASP